ncbi:MAG: MSHA biogenesis protein MshO [Pseudohongiellaceae bacterium]|jgi:MSHA biogenesis protein MshO
MKNYNYNKSSGFTIIEIVVTIILVGIIGFGMVSYVVDSADSLNNSATRSRLASAGRTAIDRMTLELHNALPRSIRVTPTAGLNAFGDQCIEFIPVRAATNYVNPSFSGGGSISFDVIEFSPSLEGTVASDAYAAIFPTTNTAILYDGDNPDADTSLWPNFPQRRPIQKISTITDKVVPDATLSVVNLVTSHRFRRRSPTKRFFVVDQPVSFCVVEDKLYRYSNYGFFANQVQEEESGTCTIEAPPTVSARCLPDYSAISASPPRIKTLITDSVDNAGIIAFNIGTQSLTRNSLVKIELNFSSQGDSLLLNHEVLTRSVP